MAQNRTVRAGHRVSVRGTPLNGKWVQDAYVQLAAGESVTITAEPVEPPPPPPPPPPTTRPFPAPVTTQTVKLPTAFPDDGSTDLYKLVNDWLLTVPDGSVIEFPVGKRGKFNRGILLGSRKNLVFQLGDYVFDQAGPNEHASSIFVPGFDYRTQSFTGGAEHLSFFGGIVEGHDPNPGGPQPLRGENRHAIRANGSRWLEMAGMTVRAVTGDHAYLDNVNDAWVHGNTIETAGRNGWSLIKGYRHLVEDNTYRDCGYATFDIEPNFGNEPSGDVVIRRNTVGGGPGTPWQNGIGMLSVDGGARKALIERVRFEDNTATIPIQVYIGENRNVYVGQTMRDITVTGNKGPAGGIVRIAHVTGYTVANNSAPTQIVDSVA